MAVRRSTAAVRARYALASQGGTMSDKTFEFEMMIPPEYLNEDGSIKHEFYEPLFKMLGKEYGGAVVNSIRVEVPES
jgi:hypothetical protein